MRWTREQYDAYQKKRASSRKAASAQDIYSRYVKLRNIHAAAKEFGMCGEAARRVLIKGGFRLFNSDWTDGEKLRLLDYYTNTPDDSFSVGTIAGELGRTNNAVTIMAGKLGVSRASRRRPPGVIKALSAHSKARLSDPVQRDIVSKRMKAWYADNDHPKGFAGKKHTQDSLDIISQKSSAWQKSLGRKVRKELAKKRRITAINNGHPSVPVIQRGRWRSGWAVVGGNRFFYRSEWELRYAKYLEWLKQQGEISLWAYEAETFWFPVKRGVTNYTPDFQITNPDGTIEYHEVKGWMDAKSKTKIKRMKTHHPEVTLRVIDSAWFKLNRSLLKISSSVI